MYMEQPPEVPAIAIKHVTCAYGSSHNAPPNLAVLADFSLAIADNEFAAVAGRNGGGKTTLLKTIAGLIRPSAGELYIRGKNARAMSVPAISAEVGFVMQNPDRQLFAETVYDEAAYALRNMKLPEGEIRSRVEAALEAVGLVEERERFPLALDRGDRAKAVIASVLAMGSRILLLDEPAAGQDYPNSRRIMDLVSGLHEQGYTIVLVTHTMSLTAEYARRLIVLGGKQVIMDGTPREVFSRAGELAETGVLPPQIARLSFALTGQCALSAGELGETLLAEGRPRAGEKT